MNIDEIRALSGFALSDTDMAACHNPDRPDSPGSLFLARVRDKVCDAWEAGQFGSSEKFEVISGIVKDALDFRTRTCWQEFVDLGGYSEGETLIDLLESNVIDLDDLENSLARPALRVIGERLGIALLASLVADGLARIA